MMMMKKKKKTDVIEVVAIAPYFWKLKKYKTIIAFG
jgi:hypothetical protein